MGRVEAWLGFSPLFNLVFALEWAQHFHVWPETLCEVGSVAGRGHAIPTCLVPAWAWDYTC